MSPRQRIAIVGAGIGGLAAASLLAQGHEVTVFDQFPAPAAVGSGLVIQPVGQAVLDLCGAGSAARSLGAALVRMRGDEARGGRRVLDVRYDRAGGPATGLAIHRAALFGALHAAALDRGARLVPSTRIVAAPVLGPGRGLVAADGRQVGPFDLVVDASGASSALSPLRARALPFGAVWGTVPWPEDSTLPRHELRQRYLAARNMAGILPLGRLTPGGRELAAIFWSLSRADLDRWPQADITVWKSQVETLWPDMAPFLTTVETTASMTTARYSHGTLARPFAPGMVYLGDAAHRASPQLGQGANMALLDALALTLAMTKVPSDPGPCYAAMRRYHVGLYQACSAAFTPLYQSDGHLLPALRDHVLAPLSRIWPLTSMLTRLVRGDLVPPLAGQHFPPQPAP